MIRLAERLLTVKSLVPKGTRLLDIGSDHAALPITLINDGIIPSAIASDINEGPLSSAKNNAVKYGVAEKCSFVLSDGFDKIESGSYDCATICGMGGILIARILEEAGDKAKTFLVLQPMTDFDVVRRYLWDNGFVIINEAFTSEGKRAYLVLTAKYTGEKTNYSYSDLFLGKKRPDSEDFRLFAKKIGKMAFDALKGAQCRGIRDENAEELLASISLYS